MRACNAPCRVCRCTAYAIGVCARAQQQYRKSKHSIDHIRLSVGGGRDRRRFRCAKSENKRFSAGEIGNTVKNHDTLRVLRRDCEYV